jgi:hypothetical protein
VPDSNDDLVDQLMAQAGADLFGSTDDLLAQPDREPEPDPMADVEYTGDLEEDSKRELTALQKGFRERARREQERFELATDSEYWICSGSATSTWTATSPLARSACRWTPTTSRKEVNLCVQLWRGLVAR